MSWEEIRVGDLGEIITGKTPPTSNVDNYGGNIPFITPSDMVGNRSIVLTERYISEKGKNTIKNSILPPHAVCVSCIGSDMGKVVLTTAWSATNQQINSIVCNSHYDYRFVYYLMLTLRETIKSLGKNATAVPILNKTKFSNIQVAVPSLPIQKRIADFLSYYDDLSENNQKQIKLLEEAARRLYKEWFVDLRFPGHETTPIVDGVPEGWGTVAVTDLLEIKYGKDHKALDDGDIPAYGSGGIMRKVNKILYSGESVLIPRKGSLNNILIVRGDFWTIDTMFYSIPKLPNVAKYVYLFLCGMDMYAMNIGSAVPSMTVKILDGMQILLPPRNVLENFESTVSGYFDLINLLERKNTSLAEARDRLLPKLMSGELEVQ